MPVVLRVVSYKIHKGVRGLGPARRLEIHNVRQAFASLAADLVCLQEVRKTNRREKQFFAHWPSQGQTDFFAPQGYAAVYRSNAITCYGAHGNALLSRWPVLAHGHADRSDHRFEQRGLFHTEVQVRGQRVHVLVLHLGLVRSVLGSVGLNAPNHPYLPTFPSALPLLSLDHISTRGPQALCQHVPHGRQWARMSEHLPLVAELVLPREPTP
jgi:endonuclease/exonuclease/phosphatase family metal-dependent hydrolase